MAQRTIMLLTDDIDGSEASETVTYALDGVTYEIDVNARHAAELRESLARFIAVSRKAGRALATPRGTASRKAAADREQLAKVRSWARAQGLKVSERGRISKEIMDAFQAAN